MSKKKPEEQPATAIALSKATEPNIIIQQAALERRNNLIMEARGIELILGEDGEQGVVELVKRIKAFAKEVEQHRTEVKKPILDLGKRLDLAAKGLVNDLETEIKRIEGLLGEYQKEKIKAVALDGNASLDAAKISGTASVMEISFEIEDIKALYASHPDLCVIQPDNKAIRARIMNGVRELPGVKIHAERTVSVR